MTQMFDNFNQETLFNNQLDYIHENETNLKMSFQDELEASFGPDWENQFEVPTTKQDIMDVTVEDLDFIEHHKKQPI